ncbi:PA14 domain-containing protein [Nocardia crassostreae]|uniref:PA14 domain-containing protein n=1 Tax=Nocardia crassostreae TaxID=53428 RepID=UPI000AF67146|nr:PA14 domain-containing protein [Nocardia crassostreae]
MAVDSFGRITLTEGDVVSVFNPDGTLATVASVLDSKKPAALQYLYSGTAPRLTQVKDPVSGRSHTLYYNTDDSDSCYGGAAKPAGKFTVHDTNSPSAEGNYAKADIIGSAPKQMLCRIKYWDGTETRLWYSIAGTLDRIENPGGQITDYSHEAEASALLWVEKYGFHSKDGQHAINGIGPMNQTRSSLAVDWMATQSSPTTYNTELTSIAYISAYDPWSVPGVDQPGARPELISRPAPDGRDLRSRPYHRYEYAAPGQNVTYVSLPNVNRAKKVTFDAAGRALTGTDADGVTTGLEWNHKDKITAVVDGTGRRTTHVYDHADRVTDSFGPGPASCFQGQVPTVACAETVPRAHYGYDEGTLGLQATLYDNRFLSGVPAVWQTGVGTTDGTLARNWGATPPVLNTDGWSARFTGEIQFPTAGEYKLGFTVVDGVRLWIDDVLIVDSWTDKAATAVSGTYTNNAAGAKHRVRIDYYNRAGNTAALNFAWTPPGSEGMATVPGQHLAPRYGYETSKTVHNTSGGSVERAPSTTVATGYSDPANGIDPVFGLVVSKINDPGGLNLVRRNSFEKPGEGFLRKLAHALPGGDITAESKRGDFTYYGNSETRANPCVSGSAAVNQAGMAEWVAAASNSDGVANVVEMVYDGAGRIVAARINDEPWACTSYDSRGREVKVLPRAGWTARTQHHLRLCRGRQPARHQGQ